MWDSFPALVRQHFEGQLAIATVTYKGSGKRFFEQLAEQLNIPTTEPKLDKDGEAVGEDLEKRSIVRRFGVTLRIPLPQP